MTFEKYSNAFAKFTFAFDYELGIQFISKITEHDFEKHLTNSILMDNQ